MSSINGKYPVWLAAYTTNKMAGYNGPYTFWQYSSRGKAPGVSGEVDLDVWYDDPSVKRGWRQEAENTFYYDVYYETKYTGWRDIAGRRYYFGEDGAMRSGWQTIADRRYYFGNNGTMRTGWQRISDKLYLFSSEGVMRSGWQTISGYRYYFGEDGAMKRGLQMIDGRPFLFGADGRLMLGAASAEKAPGSEDYVRIRFMILDRTVDVELPFHTN